MNTVPITKVIADKDQPRKYFGADKMAQLTKSIKNHGIMNPLVVQKEGEKFLLIDGERRFRAATQLGLKEVPIIVITSKDPVSRLIEQFHIQETHEGWSPVEKAMVLIQLCEEMKKPLREVCELLNIPLRTAQQYYSFAKIHDKERFIKDETPIALAGPIIGLTAYVKDIVVDRLEEPFTLTDSRKFEKNVLENIKSGVIQSKKELSQLKDAFKTNPKLIEKFMGGEDSQSVYLKSKVRGAKFLRQAVNHASYMSVSIKGFMTNPDVKPSDKDISSLRTGFKALKDLLAFIGE